VFIAVLVAATPVSVSGLGPRGWDLRLVPLGVLLGVGEAGLASQLALLASRVAELWRPGRTPVTVEGWLSVSRGGWIRYYLRTAEAAPVWLLVAASALYVSGEEIVFRGIVISCLAGLPTPLAVTVSVLLFALVQVFYTPGWQTALFPVIGAVVVGIVHGSLFVMVPDLTPLIVAHLSMFLIMVL
jgi:membrane protease YdiL (CAAX protease family)